MTHPGDHTEEQKRSIAEWYGTSPSRAYTIERALYPITTAEEWLAVYEKWKDKGVNLEGLLLTGQVNHWIPPSIAATLL